MRIVVTSDTHTVVDPTLIPDGDVFIHAGDLMTTGYPSDWERCTDWLSRLPHKEKIYIPGNHDFHLKVYPGPALQDLRKIGVTVIGLPGNDNFLFHTLPDGKKLLGLPFVIELQRWAFNTTEEELSRYLNDVVFKMAPPVVDIVVTHSPIHGYLDHSNRSNSSVGIKAYSELLARLKPKWWFHGHIHEQYGHHKHVDGCDIYNVSMSDREERHSNSPIVLDI